MAPALHGDKEGDGGEDSFFMKAGAGELSGYNCILYKQGVDRVPKKATPLCIVHVERRFWEGFLLAFYLKIIRLFIVGLTYFDARVI